MRVFLAGAGGVLGRRLVPRLVADGHDVVGATRTAAKAAAVRAAGAEPVVVDGLDRDSVLKAVASARPDVVIHQMTALARMRSLRRFDDEFALTNRLRTEGTRYLLEAAQAAGARRFLAQSYTGWPNATAGPRAQTEDAGFEPNPPAAMRRTLDAIRELEAMVSGAAGLEGIVLRYGSFYGPGTSIGLDGDIVALVARHKLPVVGGGTGIWSFVHVDDAAEATRLALTRGSSGRYNVVDDEPAEVSVWLPALAFAIGAKPPARLPAWIARLAIGAAGVHMMTKGRGSSNAKAKRELGWQPAYPSWRDGFRGFAVATDPAGAGHSAGPAEAGHYVRSTARG